MRVCIVCAGLPPYYGGAERRALRLAQRLHQKPGVQVVLIGWDRSQEHSSVQSFSVPVYPVRLVFSKDGSSGSISSILNIIELFTRLGWLLFRLRDKFDVLHVINAAPLFNLVPVWWAKTLGKPVVVEMTLLGSDDPIKLNLRGGQGHRRLIRHRPLKYRLFFQADAYVSKSQGLSNAYLQAGLPENKLVQIPSGVDIEKFRPAASEEKVALRKKLNLADGQPIFLFLGGIEERKGSYRVLEAFNRLASTYSQAHLVIVGPTDRYDPVYVQQVRKSIQEWELVERVTFREGLAENAHEYMRAADIFVLPSSREGLSVAILEAMACGLAVIASDIPEVAQSQIQNKIEGLLISPEDVSCLADAMSCLVYDVEQRSLLGQAARQRVLREFTDNVVEGQYLELYEKQLSKHPFPN